MGPRSSFSPSLTKMGTKMIHDAEQCRSTSFPVGKTRTSSQLPTLVDRDGALAFVRPDRGGAIAYCVAARRYPRNQPRT